MPITYSGSLRSRLELLKGKLFKMSPAPRELHQRISMQLSGEMYDYLKEKNVGYIQLPLKCVCLKKVLQMSKYIQLYSQTCV